MRLLVFQTMSLRQSENIFKDLIEQTPLVKKMKEAASKRQKQMEENAAKQQAQKEAHTETNKPPSSEPNMPSPPLSPESDVPSSNPNSSPSPEPEVPSFNNAESEDDENKWMQKMYRKLQRSIHPDKNKNIAKEATAHISNAMESNDVVAALYSYYVYHDDCPIPDNQVEKIVLEVQKEYVKRRRQFDNRPIDIILRTPQDKWGTILQRLRS